MASKSSKKKLVRRPQAKRVVTLEQRTKAVAQGHGQLVGATARKGVDVTVRETKRAARVSGSYLSGLFSGLRAGFAGA